MFRPAAKSEVLEGRLLAHLREMASGPVLIGTWADAIWAIRFYERHGFELVAHREQGRLLRKLGEYPNARSLAPWFWQTRCSEWGQLRRKQCAELWQYY